MNGRFEGLWQSMQTEPKRGRDGMLRRRLTAERDDGLFLGLDLETGNRLFLVDLGKGIQSRIRRIPKWKEIGVDRIVEKDNPTGSIIRISLLNPRFADVFTAFCEDLYVTLNPLERNPEVPAVLSERLEKWAQFFRSYGSEGLTIEEQHGLFGELWFLRDHVLSRLRGAEAVRRWTGPEKAAQDFRFDLSAIEVKSCVGRQAHEVHVASANQLDDAGLQSLYLFVLRMSEVEAGGLSLPELVGGIREQLKDQQLALTSFNRKLQDAGYLDVHARAYVDRFVVIEEALFHVRDGFPRISGVAEGIDDVHYRLSLDPCRPFQEDATKTLTRLITGPDHP